MKAAYLFVVCALFVVAAGCQNSASQGNPFERRLVPAPPMGAYSAPPVGGYYPAPGGTAPAWPPNGVGAIRPASAAGGTGDGWIAANDETDRRAAVDVNSDAAKTASLAEPRTFQPVAEAKELPAAEPATTAGEQSSQPAQFAEPAAAQTSELRWGKRA